jgi:hypothetical protein
LAQRKAKLPEGADPKTLLPQKTLAKLKMFDSSIRPSGLLERLVKLLFQKTSQVDSIHVAKENMAKIQERINKIICT